MEQRTTEETEEKRQTFMKPTVTCVFVMEWNIS